MFSIQTGSLCLRGFRKYPLFLIHIYDLPDGLKSNAKLFADDTCLFSVVKNKKESASNLTNELDTILHIDI